MYDCNPIFFLQFFKLFILALSGYKWQSKGIEQGMTSTWYAEDKYLCANWRAVASELVGAFGSREQWLWNFPVLLLLLQHDSCLQI